MVAARLLPSYRNALPHSAEHRLRRLEAIDIERVREGSGPLQAGVHRPLASSAADEGRWDVLDDGRRIWRLAVTSPGASGVRFHLSNFQVGNGRVWVHDGNGDPNGIHGPYTGSGLYGDGDFWTDIVLSERAVLEYEPAEPESFGQVPFRMIEISHLFDLPVPHTGGGGTIANNSGLADPVDGLDGRSALFASGQRAVASCHLDVTCHPEWAETARAVGHIVYEKSGGSFVCSGTLLNTRSGSGIPYFLTANHCVDNDTVARSVQSFWFYQTSTCNGPPAARRDAQRSLGARYLVSGDMAQGDFALLRLNEVPAGVVFAGWDTREVSTGTPLVGVHHPAGDYKRISFGSRVQSRPGFNAGAGFYHGVSYNASQGIAEGGSSGSGLFTAPGVLVGMLSHGPKVENSEQLCSFNPLVVHYGQLATAYPSLRDFLEDRTAGAPPPPPSTGTPASLASGQTRTFSLEPVSSPTLLKGSSGFQITVPPNATRLEIRLSTPGADVIGLVRFNQEPTTASGELVADHTTNGTPGNQSVVINALSNPPLRAGVYYIALAVLTTGARVSGSITATILAEPTTPPPSGGNALVSGVPRSFTLSAVNSPLLFNADPYTIQVPAGASRLEIRVSTATANADVDLVARFGQTPDVQSGEIVADYGSEGPAGEETIVITASSSPPLRPGTYYVALALFTTGIAVNGTITATVSASAAPPPGSGDRALISGTPRSVTLGPVNSPLLFNEDAYTIHVPEGASRLEIRLTTATPGADIDLFARFGQPAGVQNGAVVAEHRSEGPAGEESIVITASSSPPLRSGVYHIALALFTANVRVNGTLTATVAAGSGPPPPSTGGSRSLVSGTAATFQVGPSSGPVLFRGADSYTIDVPQGATRLEIRTSTATPDADIDLYARFGVDTAVSAGSVVADHRSESGGGDEMIVITPTSNPPLRAGRYYVSLALFTPNVAATGTLTATVSSGPPSGQPAGEPAVLVPGTPQPFSVGPVDSPRLFNANRSFLVDVPEGAVRLDVQLSTATQGADVDLHVRFGEDTGVSDGAVVADHRSEGPTGNEIVTVSASTSPPLRPGRYYVSLALFTPNAAVTGTLVARLTLRDSAPPPPASARSLTSGVPAGFQLPAVDSPTLFTGDYGYTIEVPEGATKLRVRVAAALPSTDVDLFIRRGSPVEVGSDGVAADYVSETETGNETIEIGLNSSPPLSPGVYHIALGLFTPGVNAAGTVTATMERSALGPPVSAARRLQSGQPAPYGLPASEQPTFFSGEYGYRIEVPEGTNRLEIDLRNDPETVDVDLHVRFGAEPEITNGRITSDYRSTSDGGIERIVIDATTGPAPRPGVYYVALVLYSRNTSAKGVLTATLTGGLSSAETLHKAFDRGGARLGNKLVPPVAIPLEAESKDQALPSKRLKGKPRGGWKAATASRKR